MKNSVPVGKKRNAKLAFKVIVLRILSEPEQTPIDSVKWNANKDDPTPTRQCLPVVT